MCAELARTFCPTHALGLALALSVVYSQARYGDVGEVDDESQGLIYAVNALFNSGELPEVAEEWTRLAAKDAWLVLVQHFELDLVDLLAHELLARQGAGWVAVAYEECNALTEARTVVLRRGGAAGAAVEVPLRPPITRYVSRAECGLNYGITVPPARPSEKFPKGFAGGCYDGSSIRSDMDPRRSGEALWLQGRGREHWALLEKGTHHSPMLQYGLDAHRALDPNFELWSADDMSNVTIVKTGLGPGQLPYELIDEVVALEQQALDESGQLYPAGRRLAQSSRASSPDPDLCSKGGRHSQQLANAIFVLENGEEVRVSLEERLSQLRGDQQPALAGAPEPQAGGRRLRLVFACGSEPCVVTPPEGWDGRPPTLARRSVEWGKTGGTHSQQLANAIFVLENGEEVRVSLEEPLVQLRGDQQPALAGAPEPQAGGRLRLVFACGSEPCVVTPPEGWDGRPPTLARRSVEWIERRALFASAIFRLTSGSEVRVSLEEPLVQLRGDQQPALAGAPEPQAGGRLLRLVFACGSEPCVVTPPEGWDGRPPTLARRSVEAARAGGRARHGLGLAPGLAVQVRPGGEWGACRADGAAFDVLGAWQEAQTTNHAALILAAINEKWRLECNLFGDPLGRNWWANEIQRTGYENGSVDAPALIGKSGRVRIVPGRAPRVPAAPPPSRPAPRTAPAGGGRLASLRRR